MTNDEIHRIASRVIDAIHSSSTEKIDARDGQPGWYYDLASRIALVIGDAEIRYVSHDFIDSWKVDGQLWVLTEYLALEAHVTGERNSFQTDLRIHPLADLIHLGIERVSTGFGTGPIEWPSDLSISLRFADAAEVTLPLTSLGTMRPQLAAFVPKLALLVRTIRESALELDDSLAQPKGT